MNAGVLQFSLGMAAGNFMSALGAAESKVKGFIGGMISLGAIVEGVESALEKGAGLYHLHERTGASVSDLAKLQSGFRAVGLSVDEVAPTLTFMQRALGGVDEMGQSTADIFYRLGLNLSDLKHTGAAQAMQTILGRLGQLNQNDAAKAASSIFGRMGGGNLLVAARSMGAFNQAMTEAATKAAYMEKIAQTFEKIEILVSQVKATGGDLFIGLAAGIAPWLEKGLEGLKKMEKSFLHIGQVAGQIFSGVAEAFKEGKITELLELSFSAGVEFFANLLANTVGSGDFWSGMFEALAGALINFSGLVVRVFGGIGEALLAVLDTAFQKMFEMIGKIPKLGKALGLDNYKASSYSENFEARKKADAEGMSVASDMMKTGLGMEIGGRVKMFGAFKDAFAKSGGPEQEKLKSFFAGLVARAPKGKPDPKPDPNKDDMITGKKEYKFEATALEKMGFVMGSGNNVQQEQLNVLRQINGGISRMIQASRGGSPADAATTNQI